MLFAMQLAGPDSVGNLVLGGMEREVGAKRKVVKSSDFRRDPERRGPHYWMSRQCNGHLDRLGNRALHRFSDIGMISMHKYMKGSIQIRISLYFIHLYPKVDTHIARVRQFI